MVFISPASLTRLGVSEVQFGIHFLLSLSFRPWVLPGERKKVPFLNLQERLQELTQQRPGGRWMTWRVQLPLRKRQTEGEHGNMPWSVAPTPLEV